MRRAQYFMIATIPEMGHEENRCIDYVSVYKRAKKIYIAFNLISGAISVIEVL